MFCSFSAHSQLNKSFPGSWDRGCDLRWWAKNYFWRNEQSSPRAEFQWMGSRVTVTRRAGFWGHQLSQRWGSHLVPCSPVHQKWALVISEPFLILTLLFCSETNPFRGTAANRVVGHNSQVVGRVRLQVGHVGTLSFSCILHLSWARTASLHCWL